EASLVGSPVAAPVRLRRVPRNLFGVDNGKHIGVDVARPFVARDVAADVVGLLSSGAEVVERSGHRRPVEAADVAVLVHRNDDGAMVRDALAALDVPVVLSAVSSVFASRASQEWLALLSALEQPQRSGLARNAALTDFVGWDAERLALASETELDDLGARLRAWGETLTTRGVAGLLEAATATGLARRVLAREGGERDLTDLRHIGQALHEASVEGYGGVSSLVQWLQHRMAEAAGDVDEERSRRLDSDAKAVQVMTIWRAKGLEFPVVYAPFLWDKNVNVYETLRLHGPDGHRVLDVGGPSGAGYGGRKAVHLAEDVGESLRLAYVALTRARCQVVAHWAPGWNCVQAPLTRLLFADRGADGSLPEKVDRPREDAARARLEAIAASSDGLVSAETCAEPSAAPLVVPPLPVGDLSVRSFERELDRLWRRTSYTGITAGLHEAGPAAGGIGGGVGAAAAGDAVSTAGSEPEEPGVLDEPEGAVGAVVGSPDGDGSSGERAARAAALRSPMAGLPVGAALGTLVHAVLERADFDADDLPSELAAAAEAEGSSRFAGIDPADLATALAPALRTPLGPLAGGVRLVDVARKDRLDELEFELPLAGGDLPTGDVSVGQVADLLRRHLVAGDPLHGYADDLDVPLVADRRLRGFLTGSIDAVLRVRRTGEQSPRYLVVDYKTNWLGPAPGDGDLTADDYGPDAMVAAMRHAHYPLQALLYSVALHRYLRWRQPGYDPHAHLGGVLYLFLRGMCGPDTPAVDGTPHGVFAWTPPAGLVTGLSDLLHGGAR
ncbi:MAG: 3'-5' exonuclease, partial [Nocardioides sp.]